MTPAKTSERPVSPAAAATPPHVLEAQLEAFFRTQVRLSGGLIEKLAPTKRGIPDRLVMLPMGRLFLVELKRVGEKPSPIQTVWHERAAKIGVKVVVLHGHDEIREWLQDVVRSQDPPDHEPRTYRPRKKKDAS